MSVCTNGYCLAERRVFSRMSHNYEWRGSVIAVGTMMRAAGASDNDRTLDTG